MKDSRGGKNKLVINNPFKIGEEQSDYWIGYLAADGFLSSKKYLIGCKSKDIEHLEQYKIFVGGKVNLRIEINRANNLIAIVNFGNYEIYNYLLQTGLTPKKSLTFKYQIPLNGNILRGHFDGDGSISQNRPKITTGSYCFVEQLCDYYNQNNLKYSISKKGNSCWDVFVLKESRKDLYKLMYENSTIFLKRKQEKYAALISNN